jgi:hypothetical protein
MIPKEVDLWLGDYLVSTADMLLALCSACSSYIDWKHDIDLNLHGSCCGVTWNAEPANRKLTMYRVHGGKVDLSNVIFIPV